MIRRVETGAEEVVVIRHGRAVARIVPSRVPPRALLGVDSARAHVVDESDNLLDTGETWEMSA